MGEFEFRRISGWGNCGLGRRERADLAEMQFEHALLEQRFDLHATGVVWESETAFEITMWTLDPQTTLVFVPRVSPFSRNKQIIPLDNDADVLRPDVGEIDFEEVLLGVFQDIHRGEPIGLPIAGLAGRNRRQRGQEAMIAIRRHVIHTSTSLGTVTRDH